MSLWLQAIRELFLPQGQIVAHQCKTASDLKVTHYLFISSGKLRRSQAIVRLLVWMSVSVVEAIQGETLSGGFASSNF
jgi:hypothetical protein